MRSDLFGSNTTGWGVFNLFPSNSDGKILAHEVGHYLNLYHTFHAGCAGTGDLVSDTTPEAVNNWGCPGGPVVQTGANATSRFFAQLLKERLVEKVDLDFDTARRLFTLICVLHIKG